MLGQFKSAVDIKGRMNFPSRLREELGECFVISKTIGADCIKVYSKADWQELAEKIKDMPQVKTASIQRFLFGSAFEIEPDKQGRIIIPAPLREYAEIESDAVIVGLEGRAEIWSKANWDAINNTQNAEILTEIAMELGL